MSFVTFHITSCTSVCTYIQDLKKVWTHPTVNGYEGQDYAGRRITMVFKSLYELDEELIWVASEHF